MRSVLAVSLVLVSGCGMSMNGDAAGVEAAVSQVEALVVAHAGSADAIASATCAAEMTRYRDALGQPLASLGERCPRMDGCLRQMGQLDTDFDAAWLGMRDEADAHAASGCQASDRGAELQRHREAMAGMCQHLRQRATDYDGTPRRGGCR